MAHSDKRSIANLVGLATLARVAGLPISFVSSMTSTYLILRAFDASTFATFGLLVSIAALLPFADLGLGARVVNVVADGDRSRAEKSALLWRVHQLLFRSAAVLIVIAAVVQWSGAWEAILGTALSRSEEHSATLALGLFACTVPFGLGQRLLLALDQNHTALWIQAVQPLLTVGLVLAVVTWDLESALLAPSYYLSGLLVAVATYVVADRKSDGLLIEAVRARTPTSERVWTTAVPMLVVMVCLPLAIQGHRLVLSHIVGAPAVAQYQLATQFFNPVWAAVSVAGTTLWPHFARQRTLLTVRTVALPALALSTSTAVAATGAGLAAWFIGPRLADGQIELEPSLLLSFGLMLVAQGTQIAFGIALTDPQGLRIQAFASVGLLITTVPTSLLLAPSQGAWVVPAITATGIIVFQLLPNSFVVVRRSKSIRRDSATK